MYVDLDMVDADSSPVNEEPQQVDADGTHVYLGADVTAGNYGSATVDDLEFWFGERSKLIELDFLLRGISIQCNLPVTWFVRALCKLS